MTSETHRHTTTHRATTGISDQLPHTPEIQASSPNTGGDCSALGGTPSPSGHLRVGRHRLAEILSRLTVRDHRVLDTLWQYRYVTTRQLARLFASEFSTPRSAARQLARQLRTLHALGVVQPLSRRHGGTGGGSSSQVWAITNAGVRALHAHQDTPPQRVRFREPSLAFLEHTLAIFEVYVRLVEQEAAGAFQIEDIQPEPTCWRDYLSTTGTPATVRPDLRLQLLTPDGYEDHFFLEIDRATENPARVVTKARTYMAYYATGREQSAVGVVPCVSWLTPNERRTDQLRRYLHDAPDLTKDIFHVHTMTDFPHCLTPTT